MAQTRFRAMTAATAIGLAGSILGCGNAANQVAGADAAPPNGDAAPSDDAAPSGDTAAGDAAPGDAASSDAGAFACGDALCDPSQICLSPAYGCTADNPSDAGVCPDGSSYLDAAGGICLPPLPAPSCVSPAPGAGSFDCSGPDAGASCSEANAPIPAGCSRYCSAICA
jgi:hypothetical protein